MFSDFTIQKGERPLLMQCSRLVIPEHFYRLPNLVYVFEFHISEICSKIQNLKTCYGMQIPEPCSRLGNLEKVFEMIHLEHAFIIHILEHVFYLLSLFLSHMFLFNDIYVCFGVFAYSHGSNYKR